MNLILAIGPWQLVIIILVVLVGLVPSIIALIDIFKSQFKGNNKVVWVLIVLFFGFIGAVIYFLIGREQKIATNDTESN